MEIHSRYVEAKTFNITQQKVLQIYHFESVEVNKDLLNNTQSRKSEPRQDRATTVLQHAFRMQKMTLQEYFILVAMAPEIDLI